MDRKISVRRWPGVVAALLVLIAFHDNAWSQATTYPSEIRFPDIGANGIFDPSLGQAPGASQIFMSYTAVEPSPKWPEQNPQVTSTRLAVSSDSGATWTDQALLVNFKDVTLAGRSPGNAGTWISEVSSIVYDPTAPSSQRWKLMFMHFLIVNGKSEIDDLWIGLKMASSAAGLRTASEIKLFAGAYYNTANNKANGTTRSPLGGAPAIALDTEYSADLNGCVFAEPGMATTSSALYLAIVCNKSPFERKVALFKCASPCTPTTAASWKYLGSTLDTADAALFGYDEGFSASNLVIANDTFYVIVTPQSSTPWEGHYNGCMIFPFDDIETATIARLENGAPRHVAQVDGTPGSFNGACTYLPAASAAGVIYSELNLTGLPYFRMLMSGVGF